MTGASLDNPPVHTAGSKVVLDLIIDGKSKVLVFSVLEAQLLASLLMAKARDAIVEAQGLAGAVRESGGGA